MQEARVFTGPQYLQRACNRTPANGRVAWRRDDNAPRGANCSTQRTPQIRDVTYKARRGRSIATAQHSASSQGQDSAPPPPPLASATVIVASSNACAEPSVTVSRTTTVPAPAALRVVVVPLVDCRVAGPERISHTREVIALDGEAQDLLPSRTKLPPTVVCVAAGTIQALSELAAFTAPATSSMPAPHVLVVQ